MDEAIKIEARNGVVTLAGTVDEESHRILAEETVANLPGFTRRSTSALKTKVCDSRRCGHGVRWRASQRNDGC